MTELAEMKGTGITIRPVGGLGNQLFIYAAGRAVADRLGCALYVDLSYYAQPNADDTPRTPAIEWLIEPNQLLHTKVPTKRAQLLNKVRTKFHLHNSSKIFQEHNFAYDQQIERIHPGTTLVGYFQSWKYIESIADSLRTEILDRAPKSDWFLEIQTKLGELSPWIALHVRLGDYLAVSNTHHHGIVGREYYEKAINEIESRIGPCKIILFSDDPEKAESLISPIHPVALVIQPPPNSHPMESIVLMSQADAIITANSSFSWWAAWLANLEPGHTFAPEPWFAKKGADDSDLCPTQWVRLPSSLNT